MRWSVFIAFLICSSIAITAYENLDEIESRTARKATHTFYSGESAANGYLWQPQTLCYTDVNSSHEIWMMTCTDDASSYTGGEYGHQPWSADGKRLAIAINKDTTAFTRGSYYANDVWFTARADGTHLRPRTGAPGRIRTHATYTHWSTITPDIYYEFGRHYASESGYDYNMLYRVNVSDTEVTNEEWVDFIQGNTGSERDLPKDALTSDGKYIVANSFAEADTISIAQVEHTQNISPTLNDYNIDRGLDTYWGDTPATYDGWHDEMFVGVKGNYWIYFLPGGSGTWWRMRPWGTDGMPPNHTADTTSPYQWWEGTDQQKEIQPLNARTGTVPDFAGNYWSHAVPDRWGNHIAYSDTQGAYVAPGIWDVENSIRTAFPSTVKGAQYHAWTGWTDYSTGTDGANNIYYMHYMDGDSYQNIATLHANIGDQFIKPGQSPDGTKTAYRSDFLQPTNTNGDVFYVVAEYPHPPQIINMTARSGEIVIEVDWRLDSTSRGYTLRGWPNDTRDDPPPPREIKEFRLWRSADNSSWLRAGTGEYDIFNRYDFSNGTWFADDYWELNDTVSDGTWYYAMTSVENSGLESHILSNVFTITVAAGSGTGSESSSYPNNPGGDSGFYCTTPDSPLALNYTHKSLIAPADGQYTINWTEPVDTSYIRYYNIYAADGSNPNATQEDRIASIPKGWCNGICSWVDWLGATNGSTVYGITSVDYQGNEGSIVFNDTVVYNDADTNEDGKIDTGELRAYVSEWIDSKVNIAELNQAISVWKD